MNDKKTYPSVSGETSQRSLASATKGVAENIVNNPAQAQILTLGAILTQLTILNAQLERLGDLLEAQAHETS